MSTAKNADIIPMGDEFLSKSQVAYYSAVALIVLLFAALGLPGLGMSESGPPPGVETYSDNGMLCWDKTVCCDESDRSTCVTIPTCMAK